MGLFIEVKVEEERCAGTDRCGECVKVCPVQIFVKDGEFPSIDRENEDECTLCELCLKACTQDAIVIHKLYERP